MGRRETQAAGLGISRLGIGCWAFGGGAYWREQNQKDVEAVVHAAIDRGVTLFDTARMYNDGNSEVYLGQALKGVRGKAFVVSKVSPAKAYRATLKEECEASLRNLGTDYIDMYMMHWPINAPGIRHFTDDAATIAHPPTTQEAFETLAQLKKDGKIRFIGISNYGVEQMRQALAVCPDIAANELPYNVISRAIEAEILPFCARNGIAVLSSMTLQQGVLAGIYQTAGDIPAHQAHSRHFAQQRGRGTSRHGEAGAEEEIFETVALLRRLAAQLNITVAQLSIAWVLAHPGIACALVGSRNEKQLIENLQALAVNLPADSKAQIDETSQKVLSRLGNSPDYYESSSDGRIY
ncbi:MAG: aldo/keto reductase [Eubacteriales bacterium]|nr:aldo/keto reductase [Eubacteriales bacterium]